MSEGKAVDPLTVSIIEHRLESITEEIGQRTMKSCFSFSTAHIRDLGVALFDKKERIIAHGDWMPVHCAGANVALKGMLDYVGRDNINHDDFIIGNEFKQYKEAFDFVEIFAKRGDVEKSKKLRESGETENILCINSNVYIKEEKNTTKVLLIKKENFDPIDFYLANNNEIKYKKKKEED